MLPCFQNNCCITFLLTLNSIRVIRALCSENGSTHERNSCQKNNQNCQYGNHNVKQICCFWPPTKGFSPRRWVALGIVEVRFYQRFLEDHPFGTTQLAANGKTYYIWDFINIIILLIFKHTSIIQFCHFCGTPLEMYADLLILDPVSSLINEYSAALLVSRTALI